MRTQLFDERAPHRIRMTLFPKPSTSNHGTAKYFTRNISRQRTDNQMLMSPRTPARVQSFQLNRFQRPARCEVFSRHRMYSPRNLRWLRAHAHLAAVANGTVVAPEVCMFEAFPTTATMSCPICGRPVEPAPDSTWVVAWYTCLRCGHEWSARIRNGRPDLSSVGEVFVQTIARTKRP